MNRSFCHENTFEAIDAGADRPGLKPRVGREWGASGARVDCERAASGQAVAGSLDQPDFHRLALY